MSLTADCSPASQDDCDQQMPEVLGNKKCQGMPLIFPPGLIPATPMMSFEVWKFQESKMPMTYYKCPPGLTSATPMDSVETQDVQKVQKVQNVQNVQKSKMHIMYPPGLISAMPMESVETQDARLPIPSDYSCITTLMLRGLPCRFTEQDVFRFVISAGLKDKCDFIYVPRRSSSGNSGYAFLNFTSTIHAWTCAFFFNGLQLDPSRSTKICTVSPATIQGFANLKKHFKYSFVCRTAFRPWFLDDTKDKNLILMARNSETIAAAEAA